MSDVAEEWGFLKTAWRVAHTLTGCQEGASKVFQETVEEVLHHPSAGDAHRLPILFYTVLRKRSLRFPARNDLSGAAGALHRLTEPGRSAWTLLLLNALPADEIQPVLGLDERQLADAVDKARAQMTGQPIPS